MPRERLTREQVRELLYSIEPEKDFQEWVVAYARSRKWLVFSTWNSQHSPAGEPDLRLVRERVIWAELKSMKGKASPLQQEAIDRLRQSGAEVYLWRPSDREEIERVLQ